MEPVRVGIIGCGVIGKQHAKWAGQAAEIEVAAVADIREDQAREVAKEIGSPRVYREGTDLIDDPDIEAVVLAMPAGVRIELALRAFGRGKHVLLEKPAAMNVGQIEVMLKARGKLVAACCSSRFRFLPSARLITEFLARGELGPLRMIQCRNLQPARPRPENLPPVWRLDTRLNGGGILVNWGCYDLDYLLGITGWSLNPLRVFARTWTIPSVLAGNIPPESDAETHYSASILCRNGILLQIERGEYMVSRSEASWQIIGDKGSLDLTMTVEENKKIIHHSIASPETGIVSKILWEGLEDKTEVHRNSVLDFARAIRNGSPPKTGLEQSLVIQKITDAIYASAKTGQSVEILDQEACS